MDEQLEINTEVTAEQWAERYIHVAKKLAIVLGLNNQERQWVRDAGYPCKDEDA